MTLRWREMASEELEREYSPSSCLPDGDYRPFVAAYQTRSRDAWERIEASGDARTFELKGPTPKSSVIGAVPCSGTPTPMLIFIHGGYWQELSAADSLFAAADCIDRGWAFAAVEYTLAPEATIDQIVDECRWAVTALVENALDLGVDPDCVVVSGSSAGAHLAAMVAVDPSRTEFAPSVAGVVLVSGVFELEPLLGTSINDAVGMDAASARRNSPLHLDLSGFPTTIVAVGSDETNEFKAQSDVFAAQLRAAGARVSQLEIGGCNHFDVILDLAAAGTTLGDAVTELINADER